MSNRAHSGRCFRSYRRTKARKAEQGKVYEYPIRWKVPQAIKAFLTGDARQVRARHDQMGLAISRYAQHQALTGKGPPIRAAGHGAR